MVVAAPAALSAPGAAAPGDAFPEIGDYALIGDCRTAALVAKSGVVEWLCLPDFSSPSIFAAMLDRGAGHFTIAPASSFEVSREYLGDTNVLDTTFTTSSGGLRLTDAMTLASRGALHPQHELLRRIECVDGEVEIAVAFAPRPGYGAQVPSFERRGALGWQLCHVPFGGFVRSEVELRVVGGDLVGKVRLRKGEVRWISFVYDQSEACVLPPLGDEAQSRLDATAAWWRTWSARCRYEGPHRDLVVRSALALKLLTSSTSGAVLAAPTTSLPEEAGGARNWDYRFCWIRDSALTLDAFLGLGYREEAEAFLEWLLHATRLTWQRFQVLYDLYGETQVRERELKRLSGYRGARPVRIGNAAHGQLQLDIHGELLQAIWLYVQEGGTIDVEECRMLAGVGRSTLKSWREPDQGIWETRGGARHHTFSKAMCWVAIDRLRRLAERFPLGLDRVELDAACEAIRAEVESRGYNGKLGSYVAYYDGEEPDASLLLLARYGYAKPEDPRMKGTFDYLRRTLAREGLMQRYRPSTYGDGLHGGENAFAPCSFWAVEYLANVGDVDRARDAFERLASLANDVGLFGEEFAWGTGAPMGNFPQAFTHVSLVSAATALFQRRTA